MGRKAIYTTNAEKQRAYRQRKRIEKGNANQVETLPFHDLKTPPLRYHGAKWRIAKWVISYFPEHICYVEPFGGGAGVLLRKRPSQFEVYNDLDGEVVNFFDMLRSRADELIRSIALTPYSQDEWQRSHSDATDPLERARRFYVRSWQGHHPGKMQADTGWRVMCRNTRRFSVADDWNRLEHLWDVAARLKLVQYSRLDAFKVLEKFDTPETLFYLDPPYLPDTRSPKWANKAYKHELTPKDHERLAERLHALQGMAIVSGYPSQLYDQLYRGWERVEKITTNMLSQQVTECLWLSPSVSIALHHQKEGLIHAG